MVVFGDGPASRNDEVLFDFLAVGQMMDAGHDGGQQRAGDRHQQERDGETAPHGARSARLGTGRYAEDSSADQTGRREKQRVLARGSVGRPWSAGRATSTRSGERRTSDCRRRAYALKIPTRA